MAFAEQHSRTFGRGGPPRGRVAEQPTDVLDRARRYAGLSHEELFLRYFALAGMSNALELEAFCYGLLRPTSRDYDVLVHAINERLCELGRDHLVAYSGADSRRECGVPSLGP